MYKPAHAQRTTIEINTSTEGETMEIKVERILNNKEPIADSGPTIYTNRQDGVIPEYNPRTDRFDLALEATDRITRDRIAKRTEFHDNLKKETTEQVPAGPIAPTKTEPTK